MSTTPIPYHYRCQSWLRFGVTSMVLDRLHNCCKHGVRKSYGCPWCGTRAEE